jgi:hypothetical protein
MPLTQLSKTQWQAYFDRFSRAVAARRTRVEPAGLGLTAEGQGYPALTGVSYDAASDALTLLVQGEAHTIAHPRQVHVDRDDEWVHAIEVVDGDGARHHILLKDAVEMRPE